MQDYFYEIANALNSLLTGDEVYTCAFDAEDSDFARFNQNKVRQAGRVTQRAVSVDLILGKRHASGQLTLSGEIETDRARLAQFVEDLRQQRDQLPEDPYLLYATDLNSSDRVAENKLPAAADAVSEIQSAGQGRDLVGLLASGGIHAGFANSLGQRNWQSNYTFNFEWSFYHQADKAVKSMYAGFEWQRPEFASKVAWADEQLAALKHQPKTIEPGRYRVYLAPAALLELLGLMAWNGFGLKAHKTKQTPLIRMVESGQKLHPSFDLSEHTAGGVAPGFQESGFLRPDSVPLIRDGAYDQCLISPRSAQEYGVATNGASAHEYPTSFDLAAGALPREAALKELGTGVYVGNLWYLNFSDRNACRGTGMTRFATFWVENGQIAGPLNVMRFDETIYRALGENLVGLTAERDFLLDATTYFQRSTDSANVPGALIDDFTFTL